MTFDLLAFDRATVRTKDRDGRLHVAMSNISKATVNPYRGNEIPGWQSLGLDPDRVYQLLRCPVELEKAAPTFNNLPVLSKHIPVSASAPMKEFVVGSTGTDASFDGTYLKNSSVIWDGESIDKIEDDSQKEWSSAYHYVADMTPGTYKGLRYDGIMRNIVGNHVALVPEGRAGSDVVVGDSKLEMPPMALKSRKALLVRGALQAYLAPKLAQDAAMPDLNTILAGVNRSNYSAKKPAIAAALIGVTAGKLAQDATLDDVLPHLNTLDTTEDGEMEQDAINDAPPPPAVDADDDPMARVMAYLKGKLGEDDLAEIARMCGAGGQAQDEDDNDEDDMPAMDAINAAVKKVEQRVQAVRQAERDVRPIIGEVSVAMDSAAAVYKLAFDHMKTDLTGVSESAFPAVFRIAAGAYLASRPEKQALAMDAKQATVAETEFRAKYPTARVVRKV